MQREKFIVVDVSYWPGLKLDGGPVSHQFSITSFKGYEDLPLFYYEEELAQAADDAEYVRGKRDENNPHRLLRQRDDVSIVRIKDIVGFMQVNSAPQKDAPLCLGLDEADRDGIRITNVRQSLGNPAFGLNIGIPVMFGMDGDLKLYSRWKYAFNNFQKADMQTLLTEHVVGPSGKELTKTLTDRQIYLAQFE